MVDYGVIWWAARFDEAARFGSAVCTIDRNSRGWRWAKRCCAHFKKSVSKIIPFAAHASNDTPYMLLIPLTKETRLQCSAENADRRYRYIAYDEQDATPEK